MMETTASDRLTLPPHQLDAEWTTADIFDAHFKDPAWNVQAVQCDLFHFGGQRRYFGSAHTVRAGDGKPFSLKKALSEQGNGRVLVADCGRERHYASVGDRLGGLAVANGWAGILLYGYVRDTVALSSLNVGVQALGTRPNIPPEFGGATQEGDAVEFGNCSITEGIWIYADTDGVVTLSRRSDAHD